jgi:hypothetical protein
VALWYGGLTIAHNITHVCKGQVFFSTDSHYVSIW